MTTYPISRDRAGFTTEDSWTDTDWLRARTAATIRTQREVAATRPLPGDVIQFLGGVLFRLAQLDGALVALPISDDETYFELNVSGEVECTAFFELGDGEIIDPAEAALTDEISVQYTSFRVGPDILDIRYFWMLARVWSVGRDVRRSAPADHTIGQFLAEIIEKHPVRHADGRVDYTMDLTVRAIAAAAAVGPLRGGTEIDGVFTVLADTADIYTDTARTYMDLARCGRRDLHERATALYTASTRLTEVIDVLAAEFLGVTSLRAAWSWGGVVEVFDHENDSMGISVPLKPVATAASTAEEVTRQLAERHLIVVGEWERVSADAEKYTAALRLPLSF